MTEGSPRKGKPVGGLIRPANAKRHPRSLEESGQKWVKCVDRTFLSLLPFPRLFDHFVIAWGIRTANLICQIIDFQGICNPCCYYVLLLRPHVWKHLALLGAENYKSTSGSEAELQLQECLSG